MRITICDLDVKTFEGHRQKYVNAIKEHTRFGMDAKFDKHNRKDHAVMDSPIWDEISFAKHLKDKAWEQLGSSGGGNHFVEWGFLDVPASNNMHLTEGTYVALMSHSGSRGAGAQIARHYSNIAMDSHPRLPKELKHLAWLDMSSEAGKEYWTLMNLMGSYAAANHDLIHKAIMKHMSTTHHHIVENHHNFAWKEIIDGEMRIVHRKGATPAHKGVQAVIPGTMTTKSYIVQGLGNPDSLHSSSHGAGRLMSRSKAKEKFTGSDLNKQAKKAGIELIGGGIDEISGAYKDIDDVMAAQSDLVHIEATFTPKIVRMA